MKINICRFILLIAVFANTFISCNSDDYKTGADEVSDTVKNGTWRVGYLYDSGLDKTANYEGYNFTFDNNTALIATKETTTYSGVWSVANSTNDADINSTFFNISFGSPDTFVLLSGYWKVVENTGTSLKLKDDSKGDSALDYLNFEKN